MTGLLLALALAAQPAAPADNFAGIWEGTVGTLPVRACFAEEGRFGAYYYQSRLQLISLNPVEGRAGSYSERTDGRAVTGARWRIERAADGQLSATWTGGGRTLPVRLRRIAQVAEVAAVAEDENACGSVAFHQPRRAGLHNVSTRATVDGTAYTKLTLDHLGRFPRVSVTTFALDGGGEVIRRLNATLADELNHDPPGWFDCTRGTFSMSPEDGDYHSSLKPVMISRRWLSVKSHYEGYCGGAHPDVSDT